MTNLKHAVQAFCNDEEGATAVEYGLIVALISVAIITAVGLIGTKLECYFNFVADCLAKGTCPANTCKTT